MLLLKIFRIFITLINVIKLFYKSKKFIYEITNITYLIDFYLKLLWIFKIKFMKTIASLPLLHMQDIFCILASYYI